MKQIVRIDEIYSFISSAKLRTGICISNYFMSNDRAKLYISQNRLFYQQSGNSSFIFQSIHDYYKMYYFSPSYDDLRQSLYTIIKSINNHKIVCSILGGNCNKETEIMHAVGMKLYATHISLCKKVNKQPLIKDFTKGVSFAEKEDANMIYDILLDKFDKYADVDVYPEDIVAFVNRGQVLIIKEDNVLQGFAVYDRMGSTRRSGKYLYINDTYTSSNRLRFIFFALSIAEQSKMSSCFVNDNNTRLQSYYKQIGYKEDGITNYIFII